ncbi:MAG TPA: hypothetical protein VFZ38_19560 [Vicinamibacterales bacterium]
METAAPRQALWAPVIAPVIWAVHFMTCYTWAALACGRLASDQSFDRAQTGIGIATAVAVFAIALCFRSGLHHLGHRLPDQPNDDGTPEDRTRFMAFTTMLLAGLSLIATLFVGAAAIAVGACR